jgi:hypothetical protein
MANTTFDELFEQLQKLSAIERLRMMELLAVTLQSDLIQPSEWHTALNATYGILADDPIERPPQLPIEDREPLE